MEVLKEIKESMKNLTLLNVKLINNGEEEKAKQLRKERLKCAERYSLMEKQLLRSI